MRRDTAVRRLRLIAERCGQVGRMRPVLCSAYVFGELPEGVAELEVVQVAFVLDLAAEQLTWCAEPSAAGWSSGWSWARRRCGGTGGRPPGRWPTT
jgi:hypothetical protein